MHFDDFCCPEWRCATHATGVPSPLHHHHLIIIRPHHHQAHHHHYQAEVSHVTASLFESQPIVGCVVSGFCFKRRFRAELIT
jgi:hypothetical protein